MIPARIVLACLLFLPSTAAQTHPALQSEVLPGSQPLEIQGDLASFLVAGVDRFLRAKTAESIQNRPAFWKPDFTSDSSYASSIEPNRNRLRHILGIRDPRINPPELSASVIAQSDPAGLRIARVRWRVFENVHGEGLLLIPPPPKRSPASPAVSPDSWPAFDHITWAVIALPDADQTPEELAGIEPGIDEQSQFARKLAHAGGLVIIPRLINRETGEPKSSDRRRGADLSNREFLYRPAFELGRHLIGYETQKILAALDWIEVTLGRSTPAGLIGWGEGGLLALYAGAVDPRPSAVCVSGCFESMQNLWQQPIERNVFGLLEQFGGAELAALILPRALIVEACGAPDWSMPPGTRAAPGRIETPPLEEVRREVARANSLVERLPSRPTVRLAVSGDGNGPFGSDSALKRFLQDLAPGASMPSELPSLPKLPPENQSARQRIQRDEINLHTQALLARSQYVRQEFFSNVDTSSIESFERTIEPYRDVFRREVIGEFPDTLLPPRPRSRRWKETEHWNAYEVVLDVFEDVIAYGILLLPKDLQPGERRPVVVCQHGLEGRPRDVIEGDHPAYHDFAAKLAERGFITFSPQNLYLFRDRFRVLQRKANPLGKTLFSIIVPQHRQIVDWLKQQPFIDPDRIAFYGLSYGGKTAMRVPPLVTGYCLSICSADFNEWVWKNASTLSPYSYVWTGEYEIFEFDLGSTFNYFEMAALIAPRPFMVERGHFDGVAPDETVAYEFAKVRNLYSARLGLRDHCEIEWFTGPHTIHGQATFEFLHKHLRWPER